MGLPEMDGSFNHDAKTGRPAGSPYNMMSDTFIKVDCDLVDCMFHHTQDDQPGKHFCKHRDKKERLYAKPCPLYRLDWQKKAAVAQQQMAQVRKVGY